MDFRSVACPAAHFLLRSWIVTNGARKPLRPIAKLFLALCRALSQKRSRRHKSAHIVLIRPNRTRVVFDAGVMRVYIQLRCSIVLHGRPSNNGEQTMTTFYAAYDDCSITGAAKAYVSAHADALAAAQALVAALKAKAPTGTEHYGHVGSMSTCYVALSEANHLFTTHTRQARRPNHCTSSTGAEFVAPCPHTGGNNAATLLEAECAIADAIRTAQVVVRDALSTTANLRNFVVEGGAAAHSQYSTEAALALDAMSAFANRSAVRCQLLSDEDR